MERTRRPRRRRHRTSERLKNILIVLLSLSAVYLSARTELYNDLLGGWAGGVQALLGPETAPVLTGVEAVPPDLIPVRITVQNGESGRFATQYDQVRTDEIYLALRSLLTEALASARPPRQTTEAEWQRALERESICFDFLGQVPLETLCTWLGEGSHNPSLSGTARRLLITRGTGNSVVLSYCNGADQFYYTCETALAYTGRMEESLASYGGNGATFAFELGAGSAYSSLDPYVLLSSSTLSPRVYRSTNPLSGDSSLTETVQKSLLFWAQSDAGYAVPGGVRFREGRETLEILEKGTITYHASETGSSRYHLDSGIAADATECIAAAWQLAESTIGTLCGAGRLYLIDVQEDTGSTLVRLGYTLDGAAVELSSGEEAARFRIQEGYITDYTLQFRSYEDTGTRSLVLRELQASAALEALTPPGRELILCYLDSGGDHVEAGWVAG